MFSLLSRRVRLLLEFSIGRMFSGIDSFKSERRKLMANAIFLGWGQAVAGRELKALQVFGEVVEYYMKLQQKGEIDSLEAFQLDPHGGDLAGFLVVRGNPEKLARLRTSPEFIRINLRGSLVVENLGVVGASTGEELQSLFNDFAANAAELA
jgi:hypothetical protein